MVGALLMRKQTYKTFARITSFLAENCLLTVMTDHYRGTC